MVENQQQQQIEQHNSYFQITEDGLLTYKNRMYIPDLVELKLIMNEFHLKP